MPHEARLGFLDPGHDPEDPNPWLALYLDRSTPLGAHVKQAWLADSSSPSRQYLLPIARPLARLTIILFQLLKIVMPRNLRASGTLHALLVWGLTRFLRPEANWLILRHFLLGSDILAFIASNAREGIEVPTNPLRPLSIANLRDDVFVRHDLNLFNFVIHLNKQLKAHDLRLGPPAQVDFSDLKEPPIRLEDMPNRWTNVLDLQTAIELFTPAYQIFLSDDDFWRATNSLQLDETIGSYCADILDGHQYLALVNNGHPLVPLTTLRAGFRLVLHGLASETLHALLRGYAQRQQAASAAAG